ncbi:MAG TPA: TonB-dependent receptor [Steroidobacteraceae bacterium]|nr:TonB-dependent receptor [Steroidobacteraceae bacterium]
MTTRTVALLLSSAVSVAFSLSTLAEPAPAPAPAAAAAPGDEIGIAEIVVTAQKRNESLETVPVAISAYTAKSRDLIGIETIQDMTNFTPGLAYSTSLDRAFIRGVGRETNNLSTNPGVATYSDGVYNSSVVAASGDSLFEDRIEILRGPQGTLYGRNAIGGTINSISKRPTPEWTAEVRAHFANWGTHNFEGVVSGPISDTMRIKFGGYRDAQSQGYYRNLLNGKTEGPNLSNGNRFYWEGQLEWDITPDLQFWMKVFQLGYTDGYVLNNTVGSYDYAAYPASALMPGAAFGAAGQVGIVSPLPLPAGYLPNNAPQCATNPANSNINNFCQNNGNTATLSRTYSVTPQLTWHTPWGADVKYLGAYTTYYYSLFNDYDNTGISSYVFPVIPGTHGCVVPGVGAFDCPPLTVFPQIFSQYVETKKYFSNEINITSHSDSSLQWIFGLFQYNERNFQTPGNLFVPNQPQLATPSNLTVSGPAAPNPDRAIYQQQQAMHNNSYAAFAQTDWQFLPTWKLTTGLRFTYDILKGSEQFRELCFGLPACLGNLFGAVPPAYILGQFTPVNDITSTIPAIANCRTAAGCLYPGVRGAPYLQPNGMWNRDLGASWHAPTGTLGVEWTPDPNTLGYLKYSRGYKSGGFNASTISVNPESQAEHIDAFELGGKEVFNRILQVNAALFYYNYQDLQIPLTLPGANGGPNVSSIVNLPKVKSYGAEFESIWQPWNELQFIFDYSYMSATIKGRDGSCLPPNPASSCYQNVVSGVFENVNGNTVPQSPRSKLAVNGNYTWRFTPGSLNYSVSYIYKADTHDSIFGEQYFVAPNYSQVDMRLSWNDSADRFTIFAFIKNLQNKLGYDNVGANEVLGAAPGTQACGFNQVGGTPQPYFCNRDFGLTPPRTYGVEVQYRLK